jgi:hypothetical protein
MPNVRVVMFSVLVLATALALARPPAPLQRRVVLSAIDWRDVKPALTCPSDLPQDCAILWGP